MVHFPSGYGLTQLVMPRVCIIDWLMVVSTRNCLHLQHSMGSSRGIITFVRSAVWHFLNHFLDQTNSRLDRLIWASILDIVRSQKLICTGTRLATASSHRSAHGICPKRIMPISIIMSTRLPRLDHLRLLRGTLQSAHLLRSPVRSRSARPVLSNAHISLSGQYRSH